MATSPGAYIYVGPWINWSRGAVLGATLTLTQRNGGLLIAFLGIFITIAGAAWWRVLSFLVHQYRAAPGRRGTLHHQQQAILRNCNTPGAAAWQIARVAWAWRTIADHRVLANLPLVALALGNMVFFAVAGVFSAEVAKAAGNETLIRGLDCGYLIGNLSLPDDSPLVAAGLRAMEIDDTLVASSYARACYDDHTPPDELRCNRFVKPKLAYSTRPDAPCPFAVDICLDKSGAAFEVDSGLIDSHSDLGINTASEDRLQYRKVTTCSVLQVEERAQDVNQTDAKGNTIQWTHYAFGGSAPGDPAKGEGVASNLTFQRVRGIRNLDGYSLTSFGYRANASMEASIWFPIPELRRADADVTIMFLASNDVMYGSAVFDPWFQALQPADPDDNGKESNLWLPSFAVNVVGCSDQHQFCNPASQACTSLQAQTALYREAKALGLSDVQRDILASLSYAAVWWPPATYSSVSSRGDGALRAVETLSSNELFQSGLPANQWTLEVTEWFRVALARLQQQMLNYAVGPPYTVAKGLQMGDARPSVCLNQKVRSTGDYISFSVLGVSTILGLGSLMIVLGLGLDSAVGFAMRRRGWKDHKRLQWAVDEKLQLQRLAYEGAGQGRWRGGARAVPVTTREDRLGIGLDVDGEHPTLRKDGYRAVRGGEGHALSAMSLGDDISYGSVERLVVEPKRA